MKLKTASHAALIAMLNITVAEGQTETAELTESQLNDLNAAVVALQGQVSTAEQSVTALNAEKEKLTASLTKTSNDLTTSQAEVARLKVFEPAGTVIVPGKESASNAIHNDADMEAIKNLPHNKALDGNPMFN
jgi:multidrug resistance efflux pump